jgi:hypothetical protein
VYSVRTVQSFGGSLDLDAEIRAVLDYKADLSPLRSEITRIVQETNKEDRLNGDDIHGGYLLALAPSTLARRKGSPIPFVEHGAASRVVANLVVMVDISPGKLAVGVKWLGTPWLRYHLEGGPVIPKRDIMGLSPWAMPLIDAAVVAESDKQFPIGGGRGFSGGSGSGVGH